MPFTFSHPAIVLPLKRVFKNNISLTGLIIGSLMPDFEYFFKMKIESNYSHTILGNLWFNLPLGIIICFIFHNIIKKPFIDNSPLFIQRRMWKTRSLNWTNYFFYNWKIICLSLIIGGYSHIFWDSFTHNNTFFTLFFKLDKEFYNGIQIYKFLQHFSSLIGAIVILIYFFRIKPSEHIISKPNLGYWVKIIIITLFVLGIRFLLGLKISEYGNVIVSGITSIMVSLIIVSMYEIKKQK